jgi:hypothetical protein
MSVSMKRNLVCLLLLLPCAAHANIDPAKLVKVTPGNNPDCVEFFSYKGGMYCSTQPLVKDPVDPAIKEYEKQNIVFDERPWQAAWGKQSKEITSVEYVPMGDNVEKWTELVTSEFIPDAQDKVIPKEFSELSMQGIEKAGFKPVVTYINVSPKQVILEFRILAPSNAAQDELQIITSGSDGLYVLHYVIKKADMGQANRDKWIAILKRSSHK